MSNEVGRRRGNGDGSGSYPVGEVARLAGVTVRALHHYDEIGLLSPTGRSEAGYRIYQDRDLDRLGQILFYRELDFPLEEVAAILADPTANAAGHLARQRHLLVARIERLRALVAAIDKTKEAQEMGYQLSAEDKLEIFGEWSPPEGYAEEAEQNWSSTRAWQRERAEQAGWTRQDWEALEAGRRGFCQRLQAVMDAGLGPDSDEAAIVADELRLSLPPEYAGMIVEGYVTNPETFGFLVRPDEQRPGMAALLRDAFNAGGVRRPK